MSCQTACVERSTCGHRVEFGPRTHKVLDVNFGDGQQHLAAAAGHVIQDGTNNQVDHYHGGEEDVSEEENDGYERVEAALVLVVHCRLRCIEPHIALVEIAAGRCQRPII